MPGADDRRGAGAAPGRGARAVRGARRGAGPRGHAPAPATAPEPAPTARLVVLGDVVLDRDLTGRDRAALPGRPGARSWTSSTSGESPGGAGLAALLCAGRRPGRPAGGPAGRRRRRPAAAGGARGPPRGDAARARGWDPGARPALRSAGQSLLRLDDGGARHADRPAARDGRRRARRGRRGAGVATTAPGPPGTAACAPLADRARTTPVVWDPHPRGGPPVAGTTVVTPNLAEARSAARASGLDADAAPEALAAALRDAWDVRAVCLTAGGAGAYLAATGSEPMFVPAPEVAAGDPCGAGDRFAASVATCLAAGALPSEAVVAAVGDASAWVADGGAHGFRARCAGTQGPPCVPPPLPSPPVRSPPPRARPPRHRAPGRSRRGEPRRDRRGRRDARAGARRHRRRDRRLLRPAARRARRQPGRRTPAGRRAGRAASTPTTRSAG